MACTKLNNPWTEEETKKLRELLGKMSFEEMMPYLPNRTKTSIFKKAYKLGFENKYKPRKHYFDVDFWKDLDIQNAYFGGFFCADGYVGERSYVLSLSTRDLGLLEEFKKACSFTGNIRSYKRKNYQKETLKDVSTLVINSGTLWRDDLLRHFNISQGRKSLTLQPPNITDQLLVFCYIIGYIDGNGWIYKKKGKNIVIGCVSGSEKLVTWIRDVLVLYFPKTLRIDDRTISVHRGTKGGKQTNAYYFAITGLKAAKIIDFLRQFPIFKLDRKWNNPRVIERIEALKQQHPHLFTLTPELQSIKDKLNLYQPPLELAA